MTMNDQNVRINISVSKHFLPQPWTVSQLKMGSKLLGPCEQWLLNPGWLMIIGDYTTQIYPIYWGFWWILNTAHVSVIFLFSWRSRRRQSHDFMFDTAASKMVEAPPSLFHDLNATNPRSVENIPVNSSYGQNSWSIAKRFAETHKKWVCMNF